MATNFEVITATERPSGFRPLHLIGLILIAGAVWLGISAMGSALTPYVNVSEAKSVSGNVQVMGYPQNAGSVDEGIFNFVMEDDFGEPIRVEFAQPKPGNFDQAVSVVAVGVFDQSRDVFVADELLVKCPSKYQEQTPAGGITD